MTCSDSLYRRAQFKAFNFTAGKKKIVFRCEESRTSDTDTGRGDVDIDCDQTASMLLNEQAGLCHGWNVALINSTEPSCD